MITGPTNLVHQKDIIIKKIVTAQEMFDEVKKSLPVDVAVGAAAVTILNLEKRIEISLKNTKNLRSIQIEQNKDILNFLGKNNFHRPKLVVGFSAETINLTKNSILKMREKNCDIIVANDVSKKDSGFNSDFNRVLIIDNKGNIQSLKRN